MSDAPWTIGVLGGTGHEGRGLALQFAKAGAEVRIGSRDAAKAAQSAANLIESRPLLRITGARNEDVVALSDTIVLAVPFTGVDALLEGCRDRFLADSLVIDVTVPVAWAAGQPTFVDLPEGSSAEHVRARLPEQVGLACAFKTLPARLLEDVDVALECDDFICGDSLATRERALAVVGRIAGLRPLDVGPLDSARALERMTMLAIRLNRRYRKHDARFQVSGI